ncbi:hypothetical protein P3J6_121579 [Pseudoalteromonas sp. 3J6]|nr:hypothetical protein P3J6_121579 [Pseudoalteromonas sp. 3J6]
MNSSAEVMGAEILLFSNDHSPKSISWQRFEQKGRCGLCADHSTFTLQVGQLTIVGIIYSQINIGLAAQFIVKQLSILFKN